MLAILVAAALGSTPPQETAPPVSTGEAHAMTYFEDARLIWRTFVPASGQAQTEQGEMLRAIEKLRDEAMRNGNGNWDGGFEILLSYLERQLLDPAVFDATALERTERILVRLRRHDEPLLDDAPYDELADRVVDLYRHYGSRPHAWNPALPR